MVNNLDSRAQQPAASDVCVSVCMSLDVCVCGGSGLGLLVFLDNSPPYILFIDFFTCECMCGIYHVYIHSRVYDTCIIRHMCVCACGGLRPML